MAFPRFEGIHYSRGSSLTRDVRIENMKIRLAADAA